MLRVFLGYDPRQPLAYTILQHSIVQHCSVPVAITPLILATLPTERRGLTEFTFSRFLVPYLCDFKGVALFMDSDIVVTGDIKELFEQSQIAVHDLQVMQNQPQFEWGSVMLFNNPRCMKLTPEFINDESNHLLDLKWARSVGTFSDDWNHCVGYQEPKEAKLYHYTQGIPCWPETQGLPEDIHWHEAAAASRHTVSWTDLMSTSVHAKPTLKRFLGKYGVKL
jgi:hypothetical protein